MQVLIEFFFSSKLWGQYLLYYIDTKREIVHTRLHLPRTLSQLISLPIKYGVSFSFSPVSTDIVLNLISTFWDCLSRNRNRKENTTFRQVSLIYCAWLLWKVRNTATFEMNFLVQFLLLVSVCYLQKRELWCLCRCRTYVWKILSSLILR